MDLFTILQERALLLSVLLFITALSSLLLAAMWKSRNVLPRKLAGTIVVMNMMIMLCTFTGIVFTLTFGYNA